MEVQEERFGLIPVILVSCSLLQVLAANTIYMTARIHVVIFARAKYPVYSVEGLVSGSRDCDPWDRCWYLYCPSRRAQ